MPVRIPGNWAIPKCYTPVSYTHLDVYKRQYLNPVDNKNRNVDFIVSMKLMNRLSQLEILFDVNSPDQYISSVLNSLSDDAVSYTHLIYRMYT